MSKLSFEALKERAGATITQDLLNSISGGSENACHDIIEGGMLPEVIVTPIASPTPTGGGIFSAVSAVRLP
ncbi:hypothetical protein [Olleya sp. Bg11-27]|uniref:hypothetical protein n=1 Tax=Olleya sp. Bg11-27 TaxID=2058135 RepID=UPI000C31A298|nr:hypothetical protein [Olleya sp. Bg11-27]AUC76480.1 hypothetical protein CW732_12700 [Olleya sp. Bg11-27]